MTKSWEKNDLFELALSCLDGNRLKNNLDPYCSEGRLEAQKRGGGGGLGGEWVVVDCR